LPYTIYTWTHDAIHNTFVVIVQDIDFRVGWEQLHVFPSTTFNISRWWIDIVLIKDDICNLVDVVIVDLTWMNLFPQSYAIPRFVASNATQAKEKNYCNWHPIDQFLPLAIEVFECLHCVFTQLCQCHLELEKAFIFLYWLLFSSKKFNHIAKMQASSI
jgi:hypothetical protein